MPVHPFGIMSLVHFAAALGAAMKVDYAASVREPSTDFTLLREASSRLQEIVTGPALEDVSAEWDRAPDGDYSLTLRDPWGQVHTRFTTQELDSARRTRQRLQSTWTDLLLNRSHKLVEALTRD